MSTDTPEYRPYGTWGIRRLEGTWDPEEFPFDVTDEGRILVCIDQYDAIAGALAQYDGGEVAQPGNVEVVRYEHRARDGYLWVAYSPVDVHRMVKQRAERMVEMSASLIGFAGALTTVECSRPNDAYTLFENGMHLDVHLAGPTESGGTGQALCGFDRHAAGVGFSVGGGVTGPNVTHHPCQECRARIGQRTVSGLHKALFIEKEGAPE